MKARTEAPACVKRFLAEFNALLNTRRDAPARTVGTIHTDNAGEFVSREFTDLLAESSIHATTSPPHVHALNG
eukprot:3270925-Pleurochrysis_carterae.AAC.1